MSQADTTEIPDAVVVSPETDAVHRQGGEIEPACIARQHHVDDDTDWRLTQEHLTNPDDRCGHPECFQDKQPITDGGVVVPAKYQAEPRQYEDKEYLQQRYWGQLMTVREIADECNTSHGQVIEAMARHGIPTRTKGYQENNCVSPFAGFYRDTAARTDEQSRTRFDPDYDAGHEPGEDDDGGFSWSVVDDKGDRR